MVAAKSILIAVVMLAAACSGETTTTGPREPAPETDCPNEMGALSDRGMRESSIRGDVDGDGTADVVWVVVDESAELGCRVFLVVQTASDDHVLAVDREAVSFSLGLPAIVDLAQIDTEMGADVVVDLLAGASTVFAGVFTIGSGGLSQLKREGDGGPAADLFGHEGSVGHLDAVDCGPKGRVIVSTASPRGARYGVKRLFLEPDDGVLRANKSMTQSAVLKFESLPRRFPEFAAAPFSSCPDS